VCEEHKANRRRSQKWKKTYSVAVQFTNLLEFLICHLNSKCMVYSLCSACFF
jgi:hypothetical protein